MHNLNRGFYSGFSGLFLSLWYPSADTSWHSQGEYAEDMCKVHFFFSPMARYEVFRCHDSEKLVLLMLFSSVAAHFTNGKLAH